MNSGNNIITMLNPRYFWDVDLSVLDESSARRLIIERVFSFGDLDEINHVIEFYGKKKVFEVLCNLTYIDPKTFNFITKLFNKTEEEFRCYHLRQSKPRHWSS